VGGSYLEELITDDSVLEHCGAGVGCNGSEMWPVEVAGGVEGNGGPTQAARIVGARLWGMTR
jgi:hypothetical protein